MKRSGEEVDPNDGSNPQRREVNQGEVAHDESYLRLDHARQFASVYRRRREVALAVY